MKKSLYVILAAILCLGVSSCWKENLPEKGQDRHQVQNLVATPGDEEVVLSWTMPEGWNPTDFLITYNDAASATVKLYTDGATTYTVSNLVNEFSYSFNVQAIYGDAVSGMVSVSGKPTTSRFPITTYLVETDDQTVTVTWEKPSTLVEGYTVKYYMEGEEGNVQEVKIGKDVLKYEFKNLTNDKSYIFSFVANYAKGDSEPVEIKAMPALAIPYFVSATSVAQGWPVTFQFNRADFPEATDVKWTFPDGGTREGDEVTYSIFATGEKQVILNAKVNGVQKEWKIDITLREWVVESTDLKTDGTNYNGFKGSYPIFSPDGKTVYGITFNKISGLYAYDIMTGAEKWRFIPEIASGSYNPGTVNPVNGDIYYGTTTAGQFYCVSAEGKLKWTFKEAGSMQSTAPVVSADGSTVYIADATGNVFAINASSGAKIWGTTAGNGKKVGSLLLNGNDLIVGAGDTGKTITFINVADGSEITTIALTKGATDIAGMAVSDDKKIAYVPLLSSGIASIDLATRTLIKEFHFAGNNVYAPVVSSNGIVVVGSKDSKIYGLKADLSEVVWTYAHLAEGTNNAFNYSHPGADTEGRVYFTNGQAAPYVCMTIDAATGTIIDQFTYKDHASCKQMGGNNYLDGVIYSGYIGASGNNGVLVGKYVGGTRKFWGGPGGDICGSGCVQSPLL